MIENSALVEPEWLFAHLDNEQLRIVDCRFDAPGPGCDLLLGERAFYEGHIPGAVYAPLEPALAAEASPLTGRHPLPSIEDFRQTLGTLGIEPHQNVIAYDASGGVFASRFWWMLHVWCGHPKVSLLNGGWTHWQQGEHPIESSARPIQNIRPKTHYLDSTERHVDSLQLAKHLENNSVVLVDARSAERYAGQHETIDPIAGHIPGALNFPFQNNLSNDQRFLTQAEIRQNWEEGGLSVDNEYVHYCGSGVTACVNLFAQYYASGVISRLYPGSWSEWIGDPARPVFKSNALSF